MFQHGPYSPFIAIDKFLGPDVATFLLFVLLNVLQTLLNVAFRVHDKWRYLLFILN